MSHDVGKVIRHLIALTGADPTRARIPRGKRRLHVHTQRVGDVRLITVAPAKGPLPPVDESAISRLCATADTVLLRGIVVTLPTNATLWLVLSRAGAIPLVAVSPDVDATLRALARRPVIVRGQCTARGIAVQTVQAVVEA